MTTMQKWVDVAGSLVMLGGLAWFLVGHNAIRSSIIAVLGSDRPLGGANASRTTSTPAISTVKATAASAPTRAKTGSLAMPLGADQFSWQRAGQSSARLMTPGTLASLELDPRVGVVGGTDFFTSACFGSTANPLQDNDYMKAGDWAGSARNKCVFGYNVPVSDRLPRGRYNVFGGPDGQPRFYLIPAGALTRDDRIKQLSEIQLIVDPEQGCAALGLIGITADGINYQGAACSFLSPGGIISSADGSRNIILPTNRINILDPKSNGGNYGFLGYPAVIFRDGFSLYFTGKDGYAPPRIYFETAVDTLLPDVNVKTSGEMTRQEMKDLARGFDELLAGTDPRKTLAALEADALSNPTKVTVKPKQEAVFIYSAKPGQVLSSISWQLRPVNNTASKQLLETNLSLGINGKEYSFTGVEDFAHCAFYNPCVTSYSGLYPTANGGFIATRYFPAAPLISDGRVTIRVQAPDTGTSLEMSITVRVRDVGRAVGSR